MKRTLTATVVLAAGIAALSLGCQKKESTGATEYQAPSETPAAEPTAEPMTSTTETTTPAAGVTPTPAP
jgi:hypothetical protein